MIRRLLTLLTRRAAIGTRHTPNGGAAERTGGRSSSLRTSGSGIGDAAHEIDAAVLRRVVLDYAPVPDDLPDPGEVVWTWVPFEEADGRGKDRPVLLVATTPGGDGVALQLTSREHAGGTGQVVLGAGPWDRQGRTSWAVLDRVLLVPRTAVRRAGGAVSAAAFRRVVDALRRHHGWR